MIRLAAADRLAWEPWIPPDIRQELPSAVNVGSESKRIDAEIRAEGAKADARINNVCRGC